MQMIRASAGALEAYMGLPTQPRASWPRPDPETPYVAMLGGSATLGKSVAQPFPALVAAATGLQVLNLGVLNAGPAVYLSDPGVLHLISRAEAAVVQVTGADTLSNPYYKVHARRNDRFIAATPALLALFPELDVTEIHFTRHLLQVLACTDADRFDVVVQALKSAWAARMQSLMMHLPRLRRLLWLSDSPPPQRADTVVTGPGPLFVDAGMLARLHPQAGDVLVVVPSPKARESDEGPGPGPKPDIPGAVAHREIAGVLAPVIAAHVRRPPLLLRQASAVS
jgi:hypothetical protein